MLFAVHPPSAGVSATPDLCLPQPPSGSERFLYLNPSKAWVYLGILASGCLLVSHWWFLEETHLWWYAIYIFLTTAWTLPHFLFVAISRNFNLADHIQTVADYSNDEDPSVDVFITTCGEPLDVIENTISYATRLTYRPLTLYVLDDGQSLAVKTLAETYGIHYLTRPNPGQMKKAGNLLYGYEHSQGTFILVLDADFAVAPCALEHMVPWMKRDPKIGILQTPQYFDTTPNLSWTARGAAYCQEVFYRVIQPARDYLGQSAICVGTNALYRRAALAENGGFYQVPSSEDVHNGVALIDKGWSVKYLPILIARGLCPDTPQSLFKQHYRWCSGSMKLISSRFFWLSRMPLWQKMIYFCGACYYPAAAFSVLITLLHMGVMDLWLYEDVRWYSLFLFLPKMLLVYLVMPFWNQSTWGIHSLKAAVMFSWAYLIAFWDLFRGQTEGWIASGSGQGSTRYSSFRNLLGGYCLIQLLLLLPIVEHDWYHFIPLILGHCFTLFIGFSILVGDS
jgi:cellulose synthase (UDP-forming)